MPGHRVRGRRPCTLVGNVDEPGARHPVQQLPGEVSGRPVARGREVELSRARFRVSNKLGHGRHRHLGVHHQHVRRRGGERHRREIPDRIVGQRLVEIRHDAHAGAAVKEQRVAVRRRPRDEFRADDAGRAAAIVHDQYLAQALAQPGCHRPQHEVQSASWRIRNDDADRPRRILRRWSPGRDQHQRKK